MFERIHSQYSWLHLGDKPLAKIATRKMSAKRNVQ